MPLGRLAEIGENLEARGARHGILVCGNSDADGHDDPSTHGYTSTAALSCIRPTIFCSSTIARQFIKKLVQLVHVPDLPAVNAAGLRHASILDQFIEFAWRYTHEHSSFRPR